jgi:hypothetical protein
MTLTELTLAAWVIVGFTWAVSSEAYMALPWFGSQAVGFILLHKA